MSIFVLYNGQKKTIKVSPNTLMQQVLQEATQPPTEQQGVTQ